MRIDALGIGHAETTITDQPPERTTAVNFAIKSLRAALFTFICAAPSITVEATDTPTTAVVRSSRLARLEKLEQELNKAWGEIRTYLLQKSSHLEKEYAEQLKTLRLNKITGNARQLEQEWAKILMETLNLENDRDHTSIDGNLLIHNELDNLLQRNRWLMPSKNTTAIDQDLVDDTAFTSLNTWRLNLEERYRETLMTDETGKRLLLFPEELAKNPALTPEKYTALLADRLKTPQKLAIFLKFFFQYTFDTDDIRQPLKKGARNRHFDYDQTVEETLRRTEGNRMLGDCEDNAEFCEAVLKKMGINAAIVHIKGKPTSHCTCVWLVEHNEKYIAGDIGTLGFYLDDQLIECTDFSLTYTPRIPTPILGRDTKEEAMKVGMRHLHGVDGLSLDDWSSGRVSKLLERSKWSRFQPWEQRWQQLTMEEFTENLLKPVTPELVAAGTDAPAPPPEE